MKKYHETQELDVNEIYPYRIEGLRKNMIPTATDFDVIDHFDKVLDEESAHTAREISLKEGIFAGYICGAAVQAIKQLHQKSMFDNNSKVVAIFPDNGSRYMSKIYNDQWMRDQEFFDSDHAQDPKKVEYIQ